MYILPGYRGTYIRGYVLSGHCNLQQISVKTEGVLIYGVLRYLISHCLLSEREAFSFILALNKNWSQTHTVRSGAEERTFPEARLDVFIFRLRSYHVLTTYTADD